MTPIPFIGFHRDIGLHADQDEARLVVVRRDIDQVFELNDENALFAFVKDLSRAPEARLLAGEKIHRMWDVIAAKRTKRPKFTLEEVDAWSCGLGSLPWRSPVVFGVISDTVEAGAIPRPVPLPDDDG